MVHSVYSSKCAYNYEIGILNYVHKQELNFGLKVGVPIKEEENVFWNSLKFWFFRIFIARQHIDADARDIDIAILPVCPFVRPSVCPWHAGIVWKWLNISS